jgi:hypothetical protein
MERERFHRKNFKACDNKVEDKDLYNKEDVVRKKLVSIALALMLICGYNAKALSVDAYSTANKFRDDVLSINFRSGAPTNVLSIDQMDKNLLIGKISSVMHYKAGQLVAIQERDGTISLYDAAGYRATLSETLEGSGVFKISNLSLRYTDIDWKAVDEQGAAEWLGDYLYSLGFEEGGFLGQEGAHGFAYFAGAKVIELIKEQGINSSFSFAADGNGALTCTLNLDGKPQNTFNAFGELTAKWEYNPNTGALEQSIVYSWQAPVPANNEEFGKWIATITYYNSSGKEIETYRADLINGKPDYPNQVLTTTYKYDKNGSKISEFNIKDNDYTYYSFGKPIEIVHVSTDTGHRTVKEKYIYYSGGTLKTLTRYNENGEQYEVMVFSPRGRHLGTGTTQDPETLFRQLEEVSNMVRNLNATNQEYLLKYLYDNQITEVYLTVVDIQNPYVFMTFFLSEAEQKEVLAKWDEMKAANSRATLQDAIKKIVEDADTAARNKGQSRDESDAINAYRSVLKVYDIISKSKEPFKITVQSGTNDSPDRADNKFLDLTLMFSITFTDNSQNPPVNLTLSNQRSLSFPRYDPAVVVVGSAQAFVDADGNVLTENQARYMVLTGKPVYLKLRPDSVNMFDGAGFRNLVNPQEGEQIYVAVTDITMFMDSMKAINAGTQVMVTGLVTNDIDGKMTMQVYNAATNGADVGFRLNSFFAGRGYSATAYDINRALDEIDKLSKQEGSWVYKNMQTNQGIFQASGAFKGGYLQDWKDGWAALANAAKLKHPSK